MWLLPLPLLQLPPPLLLLLLLLLLVMIPEAAR
jgi:hypothetical protein